MAGRKENLKSLFSNTRSRVIIVFTAALLILAVVIGYFKLRAINTGPQASANLSSAPGAIQSIPGVLNPTAQYAKLQEEQNVNQALTAEKTGGSAIPTIIRTQALGQGVGAIGSQNGQSEGVGFTTLARENQEGAQRSLWIQNLQNSGCSKSVMNQVLSQGGQLSDLKAGCSCVQLKDNGYNLHDLNQICACKELRAAGFNARQLKDAGYTAARLRDCEYSACELREAGFTIQEMKDAGFSDGELKGAGFSDDEINGTTGLPEGISTADVLKAGCSPDALSALRKEGVSASALRRISGCSAEQLKAAGYAAKDLMDAGFNAADVLKAGCSPDALSALRKEGVSASAIRRISGCSAAQLKAAGYTAKDLKDAGFSAADLKKAGYTPDELKAAGYTARDLLNAGFTPEDLAKAGYTAGEIKDAEAELPPGITPADVRKAGCDPDALRHEREAGVSATLIKQYAGCSAQALKAAGFTNNDLANAGFTPQDISAATPLTDAQIKAAGCDPTQLKKLFAAGVTAKQIKNLNGCSADALKNAGYDAKSLLDAGYTPAQLLAAGFSPQNLENAGVSPADILAAGRVSNCSVDSLKEARAAGVSAATIKKTLGCSAKALKDAGYTAKELKDAGFTAGELKNAGFSAKDLKDAGFTAGQLKDAGFSAKDLKDAGFTAGQLKDAGFSAKDLKDAGFTAGQLKDAGFSAKDLKDAGFTAGELKNAGFSAKDLKDAGFTADQLNGAGFSAKDLKDAGFTAAQLKDAGFTAGELKAAGYSSADLTNAGFSPDQFQVAGLGNPNLPQQGTFSISGVPGAPGNISAQAANSNQQLQTILNRQSQQMAEQKYQQKIQQKTADMLSSANQLLAEWKNVPTQTYTSGQDEKSGVAAASNASTSSANQDLVGPNPANQPAILKTGDVLFAVMDTSVNSDEPGPILATIVSGKLKGSKLIGSFNLPSNANKMVITFNTLSIPGASKTTSISAYAIDPNTARTAISSKTNHHYLMRYGSLFASSFLEGFGNAFQSANTTVTIGGTGGGNNVTVSNGIGRSTLENAVIGLATVGKTWGQQAQQLFNTPTTVEVYAGTPVGILFTQDVRTI
ncbi:MAG: type IVB secretion system protein DotG/IcmE [Legionella sp.]|uniref:type IVB secretion system protein DotG/IcmE n=1 Tax=Legionella sp. TaxID=459 RepID=UPI0039E6A7DC